MANVSSSNGLEKRPKLRFPGFDEPYRTITLGQIASLVNRTDPTSNAPIMMLSAGNGFIMQSEKYSRDNAGQSLKKYILLKKGELAYNHGASKAKQYGCCYELTEDEARIPYVYHCFKVSGAEHTPYVATALNNPKIDRQLKRLVSSSVRMDGLLNISFDDYMSVILHLPSLKEQTHIADFLKKLDERITAQEKLVASLKKYKRGLLRKVFAKLSDSCEKRNLKEVSVLFADGDWIESKDQALDGIRLIQTGNVGFGVYIDKTQNAKYISETTFHRLNCLEIYDGDILISRLPEPAGRACLLPKSTERRITAVDCTVIRTDSSVIDRNYLLQFLCSEQYLKTVNSFLAGGTRQRISRKNLEGIEVPYPSIDEQRYWGSFLCKVDARISNEEQRRSSLSRLRCFMLQQLFT